MTKLSPLIQAHETARHKKEFLDAFANTGNIRVACDESGVGRRTVFDWRAEDPEFAESWTHAEVEATEFLEREAWRRASQGVTREKPAYFRGEECGRVVEQEYSDTLLIFLLKARDPAKYRDNYDVTVRGDPSAPLRHQIELVTRHPDALT